MTSSVLENGRSKAADMYSALFLGATNSPTDARRLIGAMCRTHQGAPTGAGEGGRWRRPWTLRYSRMTVLLSVRSCTHPGSTTSRTDAGRWPQADGHDVVRDCSGTGMGERGSISSTSTRRATERPVGDTPTRRTCVSVREPEIWVTMLSTPLRGYGKASGLIRIYLGRSSNLAGRQTFEGLSSRVNFWDGPPKGGPFSLSCSRRRHLRGFHQRGGDGRQMPVLRDIVTDEQLKVQSRGVVA